MSFKHSVMVMLTIGIKNNSAKCHILSNKSLLNLTVNAVVRNKIKGHMRATASNSHFEEKSCEVNSWTLKSTAKRVITPITAPIILERLVEVTSKVLYKKSRTDCLNEDNVIYSIPSKKKYTRILYHIFQKLQLCIYSKNIKIWLRKVF